MKKLFKGAPAKGAAIHGALLLVMLIYGYRVWTKDKKVDAASAGDVVLWNKSESDLMAVEYATPTKTVKLERRGEGANHYWWGSETKETPVTPPPPTTPPAPPPTNGSGAGSAAAGSGAGSGSAAKQPPKIPTTPGAPKQPRPGAGSAGAGSAAAPKPAAGSAATPKPATPKPATGSAGPAKWGPGPGSGSGAGSGSATGSATGSGAGSAKGSGAGSGSGNEMDAGSGSASVPFDPISGGPTTPPPVTSTREFPTGEGADKVIKAVTSARALRDLGKLTDDQKKEYKLDDTSTTLSIVFKSGTKSFVIGGSVYGGSDKYALDTDSGKGYVLSGSNLLSPLEQGESGLRLNDPKGFAPDAVAKVTVSTPAGKARTGARISVDTTDQKPDPTNPHAPPPGKTKTWGDPATNKPDQTLANFIDNVDRLKPTKYESELQPADLTKVVTATYQDSKGSTLGSMTVYKRDKPAENGLPATVEYYIMTEKTRVPGVVPKSLAERVDQDVATVFAQ